MNSMERFIPAKRILLDGSIRWYVWDTVRKCYSTFICHGRYRRKYICQFYIDFYNREYAGMFK